MFYKTKCSEKFRNIPRKTPVLESVFNKEGLKACNFIKKRLQRRCFPVDTAKFLRRPILKNMCERLLLKKSPKLDSIAFRIVAKFILDRAFVHT